MNLILKNQKNQVKRLKKDAQFDNKVLFTTLESSKLVKARIYLKNTKKLSSEKFANFRSTINISTVDLQGFIAEMVSKNLRIIKIEHAYVQSLL